MPSFGYKIKTTRAESPHGKVIIVHSPFMVRIAQTYQGISDSGKLIWYCWVMTIYSPEQEPSIERFPAQDGYNSFDELEEKLATS
jgi:hypothetical protein